MDIAIIGAGMAGLACANQLSAAGHQVALFDKGRGPGGRMSTRRLAGPQGEVCFDHGAQYFTARDPAFQEVVADWQDIGLATPWPEAGLDAWTGVPGMNAVIKRMAEAHDVAWSHLVTGIDRRSGAWWLSSKSGEAGPYAAVVLAIPAEQAAAILALHDFPMTRIALLAKTQPCWTAMFAFDQPLVGLPSIIRDQGSTIAWGARNNAKPGRDLPEAWVVQASAAWSETWLEAPQPEIAAMLLQALADVGGSPLPKPTIAVSHRWRYALSAGTGHGMLWNQDLNLGVCGDWLMGPRVECAWLSGNMLAETMSRCLSAGHASLEPTNHSRLTQSFERC